MKKTWIKVKRGLLKPEHRERMGRRIWLYLYMLDITDWESGTIKGWTDKQHAKGFGMPWRTVQKHRQELATLGYINCKKAYQSTDITIGKWVNPRSYAKTGYTPNSARATQSSVPIHAVTSVPLLIDHILNTYGVSLPEILQVKDFINAWVEWEQHRKEKKKKLTKLSVKKQLNLLGNCTNPKTAVMIIDKSILNGWTGLFSLDKNKQTKPARKKNTWDDEK